MTAWYGHTTAGFLQHSLLVENKHGLEFRLAKFAEDSGHCASSLMHGRVQIGFGAGISDDLFAEIDLHSHISQELQDATVFSDEVAVSCYLAAINPLSPIATLRRLLSDAGIRTRTDYETIENRGQRMFAVASSFYFSLSLYPAIKSSADYSGVGLQSFFHFFVSSISEPNPDWNTFFSARLREPLLALLFSESDLDEAQLDLINTIKTLSEFEFSDFNIVVLEPEMVEDEELCSIFDDDDDFADDSSLDSEEDCNSTERLAELGDAESQFLMGIRCSNPESPIYNEAMAVSWFHLAAKQGHVQSQNKLGIMLVEGNQVEKNVSEGARWLEAAAEQGDSDSQYCLGKIYSGAFEGIAADYKKAGHWYYESAKQGDAMSQFELGILYQQGLGIEKDISMGFVWILISARGGYQIAIDEVARISPNIDPKLLQSLQEHADTWFTDEFRE